MKSLVIVQPYIPSYRLPFFDGLQSTLAAAGISTVIAAGRPAGDQAARGDQVSAAYQQSVRTRHLRMAGRSMNLGGSKQSWAKADAVILGLEGTSLDLYRAIMMRKRSALRVGVWGHIGSYVNPPNALDMSLERWQMNHSDQVFAYTSAGARVALDAGVPAHKVTTVMNAVDTTSLAAACDRVSSKEDSLEKLFGEDTSSGGRYLGYVGGIDASKRIGFLAESLDLLWESNPDVTVLVAGKGPDEGLLAPAVGRGQVRMLGYADDRMKAHLAAVVDAFVMPGRVGLVAVETLLLRKPLLTTDWPFHSVEIDYLTEGSTKFTSSDNPESFAELMGRHYDDAGTRFSSRPTEWNYPTVEDMVDNFADGVMRMLAA